MVSLCFSEEEITPECVLLMPEETLGKIITKAGPRSILVQDFDMQNLLLDKERRLKSMGLTLQPHVVVVCDDLDKLDMLNGSVAYAVIQSNLYYQVASVSAAVEVCFKACFVFNLCYSAAAKSTWTFLQVAVFDIKTEHDEVGSRVLELLSEIKR